MIEQFLDRMEEHLSNNWLKYLFAFTVFLIGALVAVIVSFYFAVDKEDERQRIEIRKKTNWFYEHGCVHDGYIAGRYEPHKLYRCGDKVFIWKDIPTE